MAFVVEKIPDKDLLFHHVAKEMWVAQLGRPSSACFKKKPNLSVNWSYYSSIDHTRRSNSRAVISVSAGECRAIGQEVTHSPIEPDEPFGPNQAHADIVGEKPSSVADRLARMAKIEWLSN